MYRVITQLSRIICSNDLSPTQFTNTEFPVSFQYFCRLNFCFHIRVESYVCMTKSPILQNRKYSLSCIFRFFPSVAIISTEVQIVPKLTINFDWYLLLLKSKSIKIAVFTAL